MENIISTGETKNKEDNRKQMNFNKKSNKAKKNTHILLTEFKKILILLTTLISKNSACLLKYHPPFPPAYSSFTSLTSMPFFPSLPTEASTSFPSFPTSLPCPASTFLNRTSCLCLPCHSNCNECSGPTERDCLACKAPSVYRDGGFYGISSCWDGLCGDLNMGASSKYLDRSEGICKNCYSIGGGIKECLGGDKDDAMACNVGFNLVKGRCIPDCVGLTKFYDNTLFFECFNCHADCGSCDGNQKSDCLTCGVNKLLKLGRCYTVAGGSCNSNQFFDLSSESCQSCHSSCLTCEFHSKNCLTCQPGDFFYKNRCYSTCPIGTYPSGTNCLDGLANCKEFSGSECIKCQKNLVLKEDASECITKSTGKYFLNGNNKQTDCDLSCPTSCFNGFPNGCTPCDNYFNGAICQDCISNQYHSHIDKKCYSCHASCQTCYQGTMFACLSCPLSKVLYNDGSCGNSCASNQFPESYFTGCQNCHLSCQTCFNGEVDGCKTCPSGRRLVEGNRCILECSSGWFLLDEKSGCVRCHESCLECKPETGHLKGNCLSCKPGYLAHITTEDFQAGKWVNPSKKFCYNQPGCAAGYFLFNSTTCVNHNIPKCHYAKSKTECYKCDPGLVARYDGTCTQYCEDKKYPLVNHTNCATSPSDSCTTNCLECSSNRLRGCIVCKPGFYLQPDRTCRNSAPLGFYLNAGVVKPCHHSCASCQNSNYDTCLSCFHIPLYNLLPIGVGPAGTCVSPCPDSYSPKNGVCKQCHGTCLRCSKFLGEIEPWKGCTQCYSDKVLRADGQCQTSCPNGWYVGPGRICRPCHSSCKTCFGDFENNCLTCYGSNLLVSDTGKCQSSCPNSQYYIDNDVCYPCDATCASCDGSTNSDCTSCFPPQVLNVDGTCQIACSGGSFEAAGSLCQVCADLCNTCSSGKAIDCSQCVTGVFKLSPSNYCSPNCTVYNYPVGTDTCLACHERCYSCTGPGEFECSACDAGVKFDDVSGTCICFDGFYYADHKCNPCHDTCGTCTGPSTTDCLTCNPGLIYNPDGSCKDDCPQEFFDLFGKCEKCHETCLTCSGTTEFECSSCFTSYFFLTSAGNCLDCENPLNAVLDCQYVKDLKIVEEKDEKDIFSSNTLELIFEGQLKYGSYLKKLKNEELLERLEVTSNIQSFSYKFRLSAQEQNEDPNGEGQTENQRILQEDSTGLIRIFIDMNTTFAALAPVTINVKPSVLHWREPPLDNRLSFRQNSSTLQIYSMKPDDSSQLKNAEKLGKSMDTVGAAMEIIGVVSIFMSLVSVGAPSGPIIKIIRLFKIFFRLRLVNVEFGVVLDFFLSKMGEMMKTSSYQYNDLDRIYATKTRGKLTKNDVTVFSGFVLYDKLILYLLLRLAGISARRLKTNVKDPHNLTTFDFYYVKLIDSLKALIILSGIYDFTLYCSHEILHHDITIEQVATVKISYYQACLCLSLVIVELLFMFHGVQNLDVNFVIKYEEKLDGLKKIIANKFKRIDKREEAKQRMAYFMRRFDYKLGAINKFFIEGIKGEKLGTLTGRYFRYVMMIKLVFFELVIVSLQMLPKLQITFLSLAQLIVIFVNTKALFCDKIYIHWLFGGMDLLTEVTIMLFFTIGLINAYSKKENPINPDLFIKLQVMIIWMILVVSGLNIVQVFYHGYISFKKFLQKRKLKIKKGEGFAEQLEEARKRKLEEEEKEKEKKRIRKKGKKKGGLFNYKNKQRRMNVVRPIVDNSNFIGGSDLLITNKKLVSSNNMQGKINKKKSKKNKKKTNNFQTTDKFITDDDWMSISRKTEKTKKIKNLDKNE